MGDSFLKVVNLDLGSEEYIDVKKKAESSGKSLNILKVCGSAFTFKAVILYNCLN